MSRDDVVRPGAGDRDELLRAAVAAPSMHNTQPWRFRFAGAIVEVHRDRSRELPAEDDLEDDFDEDRTAERRSWVGGERETEGVPASALGPRPRGRRATVRDLGATPTESRRPAADFEAEPQLAVLSTRRDGPAEWLRAGQAMERVLLEATTQGVATSLLNQAIEHSRLRWLVRDPLGSWSRPQAVMRFGYGPPVPPTPRRPLADVLLPDPEPPEPEDAVRPEDPS